MTLEYAPQDALLSSLHFNNIIPSREAHGGTWYLDGTAGSAILAGSELTLSSAARPGQRRTFRLRGSWFPDAFGASMGAFLTALAERRRPPTSGEDNLRTIRIAMAAVRSARDGRTVDPAAVQ